MTAPYGSSSVREVTPFSFTHAATLARPSWMLMASTATFFGPYSRCSCSIVEGNSLVQKGHQVAQK